MTKLETIIQFGWLAIALICVLALVLLALVLLPVLFVCGLPFVVLAVVLVMWRGV